MRPSVLRQCLMGIILNRKQKKLAPLAKGLVFPTSLVQSVPKPQLALVPLLGNALMKYYQILAPKPIPQQFYVAANPHFRGSQNFNVQ